MGMPLPVSLACGALILVSEVTAAISLHPEIKYKKSQYQHKLYQTCGFLYLSVQCMRLRHVRYWHGMRRYVPMRMLREVRY
eukprot:574442-Rhodomonas_salina.2